MTSAAVDAPARDDLPPMVTAMAAALAPDPAWRLVLPDDGARREALLALLRHTLRTAVRDGTALVVRDPTVCGGVIWSAPGPRSRRAARLALVPRMLALGVRSGGATVRELGRLGRAVEGLRPAEPVWYVEALAVAPEAQGRGLGTALLAPVLAKSDATAVPCYLETGNEASVAFYRRAGFVLLGAAPAWRGGPTFWRLQRQPAPRRAG